MEKDQGPILFYGSEFYVFSNFSSFTLDWKGRRWMTSEQAYQAEKFDDEAMKETIGNARSAHEAFKFAEANKEKARNGWNDIKLGVMKAILREKVRQHPYVKKKLLESGDRPLIEDSWRDDFWGWGAGKDGENHLGKLWMEVREEFNRLPSDFEA
ncbi:MAG: NADAR family protein [bacterium]|nr:NADAR family protein [bacterium]